MLHLDQAIDFEGSEVAWGVMGSGPAVILIHGTPFSSQVWRRIAPILADQKKVYYFDLVGYGRSEKRAGQDVSLGVQNRLLSRLIDHWQLSSPDILAHDFGGTTALRTQFLNRQSYRSLTLVDPVAVAPWGSPFVSHVREHEAAFAQMPEYMHEALLRAYFQTAACSPLSNEVLDIYCEPWIGETNQSAFYRQIAQMDQCFTDEVEPLYQPTDVPTQILWGADDGWVPLDRGEELSRRLTHGSLNVVQNSGHLMQEDRPEAIVAAINRL